MNMACRGRHECLIWVCVVCVLSLHTVCASFSFRCVASFLSVSATVLADHPAYMSASDMCGDWTYVGGRDAIRNGMLIKFVMITTSFISRVITSHIIWGGRGGIRLMHHNDTPSHDAWWHTIIWHNAIPISKAIYSSQKSCNRHFVHISHLHAHLHHHPFIVQFFQPVSFATHRFARTWPYCTLTRSRYAAASA